LTFAVGTSLLTASLATVACADKTRVNVRPPEEHVNEGPESETPESTPPEQELDATTDGPEQPEPGEEPRTVNTQQADPR
jgi:hypothetical protein